MIRIIALTDAGKKMGATLAANIDGAQLFYKPQPFTSFVQNAFKQGDKLLFICAMGIVFRTLAPVLGDKKSDPPVLVLDEFGQFVVPVLSGHEGGANEWAREVAVLLDAQLVLTTANPFIRPVYTVGMGCERGCPEAQLQQLLEQCLQQTNISHDQIASINSIDIKADETGMIRLAEKYKTPFLTWSAKQLVDVEDQLSTRSDYVFNITGVYGVAESAALYAAQELTGQSAELVLNKQKNTKATCAIARSFDSYESVDIHKNHKRI